MYYDDFKYEHTTLIDNYIYFYHLDKFCILPFYPENITDQMDISWSSTEALGRPAPTQSYSHSGPRRVTFSFSLHRDLMDDVNVNVSNLKESALDIKDTDDYVDTLVKCIQSAAVPNYNIYSNGSKGIIPPIVALRIGNSVFVKGVITAAGSVTYKKPILSDGKYAQVDIQITVTEVDPYDANTIAKLGSFRGITRTFNDGIYNDTSSAYTAIEVTENNSTSVNDGAKGKVNNGQIKKMIPVNGINSVNEEI